MTASDPSSRTATLAQLTLAAVVGACGHRDISLPILHGEAVSSVVAERRYSVAMRRRFAAYGFHQRRNSCLTSAMTLPANTVYLRSKGSFL
jgi:hypothetical protein